MNRIEKIAFAGGCFWCTEAVFQNINGVQSVVSGYTGGHVKNPAYREVCMGITGHAEGVLVTYEPDVVALEVLLALFFQTHDPTTIDRQGHDVGSQYRSAIFYNNAQQNSVVVRYIQALANDAIFGAPIVTQVAPMEVFYEAELDHQNYFNDHNEQPYCQFVIQPKVSKVNSEFKNYLKPRV
jgi:peptide-methionine (S)-S-oxide reductase